MTTILEPDKCILMSDKCIVCIQADLRQAWFIWDMTCCEPYFSDAFSSLIELLTLMRQYYVNVDKFEARWNERGPEDSKQAILTNVCGTDRMRMTRRELVAYGLDGKLPPRGAGTKYRHWQGGLYEVVAVSRNAENFNALMVTYRGKSGCWTNTWANFSRFQPDGTPRFALITDAEYAAGLPFDTSTARLDEEE